MSRGREPVNELQRPIVYSPDAPLTGLQGFYNEGRQYVEVVIPSDYMSKDNKRVKARQIWGDSIYTADSDLVAVLMHMGYYAHYLTHPPNNVSQFHALLKLVPPQEKYHSRARFVKSRVWCSPGDGCAYQVERCWLATRNGTTVELQACVDEVPAPYPTVVPTKDDRQITTRTTGAKSKASQEVSVQFNLCNEPWLKYTLSAIADKGMKHSGWTSARLRDEVLMLETTSERYQICYVQSVADEAGGAGGSASANGKDGSGGPKGRDLYSFARCKAPLPISLLQRTGVPQPPELVDVIEQNADWEEFQWGISTLHLRGKEYVLKRMHFMPISRGSEMMS